MPQSSIEFMRPSSLDRIVNRVFGFLVKIGFGLAHNFLLEVQGRKSGRIYATPVNVLTHENKRYLVAPRGDTQWVRNVVVSQKATLVRGAKKENVRMRAIADDAKPEILKAYVDRYRLTVQRYFPIPAGSPLKDFEPLVGRYPVFEISSSE
ncbi:MAG: nitroreductase family deazaflavin-dependent oxidoreductase [Candidatus Binatia bacterium]|jgi:deazaflavin-dependent oxidoreductase (nitroreductase family)